MKREVLKQIYTKAMEENREMMWLFVDGKGESLIQGSNHSKFEVNFGEDYLHVHAEEKNGSFDDRYYDYDYISSVRVY